MSTYSVVSYKAVTLPDSYRGLIYTKWLKTLRYGNDYFKLIEPDAYYVAYHHYISSILKRPETEIWLAVLTDDKDVVLGFSVHRKNVLDYVYVHKFHRKLKIGTQLVPPGIDRITHLTKTGLTIWGSKYGSWKFNPFV